MAASEQGEAGDLRATAQDLGNEAVTTITGTYLDAADADMYRICLTDGRSFSASTVGATTLDTQLFLLTADGHGVYANDDWSFQRGSKLPANHRFSPTTGGVYYLAISSFNRDPQSLQGEIFQDDFSAMLYPDSVIDANGFGADGAHIGWHGRAAGQAGNYTITLTGVGLCDTTPPTVDLRAPADGARVKQGADLEVDFSCADEGGSGLDSCVGSTPDGAKLDTTKLGEVSVTVTARDKADNETVAKHTVTIVDETAPTVTIDSPVAGGVYEQGEVVTADYSCADEPGGSGVATCEGTVANGAAIDTSSLGAHSFQVRTTDSAGNAGSATVGYSVVYDFDGFFWPVQNPPKWNRWTACRSRSASRSAASTARDRRRPAIPSQRAVTVATASRWREGRRRSRFSSTSAARAATGSGGRPGAAGRGPAASSS
jgi:hypothetical protein